MPPKKPSGIETTRAQGQEMTRNTKARYTQSEKVAPLKSSGGTTASNTATMTTNGV
ncbi:hypothetical protein D3C77_431490 [compost metagenome]